MKLDEVKNILNDLPQTLGEESFETILSEKNFRMERIVSYGHYSPENFWYDQDQNEFVLVVTGSAVIEYENEQTIKLETGDYLVIPAHKKHRVKWTDPNQKTIWLAIHY